MSAISGKSIITSGRTINYLSLSTGFSLNVSETYKQKYVKVKTFHHEEKK